MNSNICYGLQHVPLNTNDLVQTMSHSLSVFITLFHFAMDDPVVYTVAAQLMLPDVLHARRRQELLGERSRQIPND